MTEEEKAVRRLSRHQTLGLMGAAALAVAVGCGDDDDTSSATATGTQAAGSESSSAAATVAGTTAAATTATQAATETEAPAVSCIVTPEMTEGPYFVDELLNRSDIRPDPSTGEVSEGVPLTLNLTVSSVNGSACTPIVGALVDMWHCDALGVYSDITNGSGQADTTGQKFLRGYQTTDANGRVTFLTIFPGWYSGRTVHIHFKVRTDPDQDQGSQFISQLYFDEALTETILRESPYNTKGSPDAPNSSDNIFDAQTLVSLTQDGDGYVGSFHVGVA